MPPQNQRRSTGPSIQLGTVDRTVREQNLQSAPANTDGPDMNKAEMFNSLSQALDLGVKAVGQFGAMAQAETDAALAEALAIAKNNYRTGQAGLEQYDALIEMYGDTPERRAKIEGGRGDTMYLSQFGVAGKYVGKRTFTQFDSQEQRSAYLEQLDPSRPMAEALADQLEQDARAAVPTFDLLPPEDQTALIGVGLTQFKDELRTEQRERTIAAKQAADFALADEAESYIEQFPVVPADQKPAVAEGTVSAYYKLYGSSEAAINQISMDLGAAGDPAVAKEFFSQLSTENTGLDQNARDQALNMALTTITKEQFSDNLERISADNNTPLDDGSYFLESIVQVSAVSDPSRGVVRPDLDEVGDVMVDSYMQMFDIDEEQRDVVAGMMQTQIAEATKYRSAQLGADAAKYALYNGEGGQTEVDTYYLGSDDTMALRSEVENMLSPDFDMGSAYSNYTNLASLGATWANSVNRGDYQKIPAKLLGNLKTLANGSPAQRLGAVALFSGLGGPGNTELSQQLTPKQMAQLSSASYFLNQHGQVATGSGGTALVHSSLDPKTEASLNAVLTLGDAFEDLPMAAERVDAISVAISAKAAELYGPDVESLGGEQGALSVFSTLPAGVEQAAMQLAYGTGSPEDAASAFLGVLTSMNFKLTSEEFGGAGVYVHDPMNRLWSADQGSQQEWTKAAIAKIPRANIEAALGTDLGFKKAYEDGKLSFRLNSSSLSPASSTAFFTVSHVNKKGELELSEVAVPWDMIGNITPPERYGVTDAISDTFEGLTTPAPSDDGTPGSVFFSGGGRKF